MAYLERAKIVSGGGTTYHNLGKFLYGTCTTAAATGAKVVTCAAMGALEEGVTIFVKFTNGNSVSDPTLNVNSTGAKPIGYNGYLIPDLSDEPWDSGAVVPFTYNGSKWIIAHSALAAVRKDIAVSIPSGQTTYTYTDSWITAGTSCYYHDLETKGLETTVEWSTANGSVTFTLGQALSTALTFMFGMIKDTYV